MTRLTVTDTFDFKVVVYVFNRSILFTYFFYTDRYSIQFFNTIYFDFTEKLQLDSLFFKLKKDSETLCLNQYSGINIHFCMMYYINVNI